MNFKKYFDEGEIKGAEKIIISFHDKILLNNEITNNSAVLLSIYMISNELKKGMVDKDKVKEIFIQMGRDSPGFDKALYEVSGKRKGKKALITIDKNSIGLNFGSLNEIKKILNKK